VYLSFYPRGKEVKALTAEQANAVYDILVREAGADNRAWQREMFIQVMTKTDPRPMNEYRFCGALGFGGKFWNDNSKWYVTAYPEDMSFIDSGVITRTNAALANLKTSYSTKAAA